MKDKNEFAKENVVEDYLADLLTESISAPSLEKEIAQKLLDKVSEELASDKAILLEMANLQETREHSVDNKAANIGLNKLPNTLINIEKLGKIKTEQQKIQQEDKEIQAKVETKTSSLEVSASIDLQESLDERFQALFFEVAGLTLAVPLIELGGIHEISKISPIMGKPLWFMGVMLKNEHKFNVVDTARWVMPEKYNTEMAQNLNYKFLINLGKTPWGFTCEKLVSTVELNKSDVKWRKSSGKRPWLAGMVKEQMCALINVAELVEMLQSGLNNKQ